MTPHPHRGHLITLAGANPQGADKIHQG